MREPLLHWSTLPGHARRLGVVVALAGALLMPPGCHRETAVQGSARVVDRTTRALSSGALLSVNGTYGAGCQDRAGAWSVAVDGAAVLDHAALTVLTNDVACALTLTELHTTSGLLAATPTLPLATSYPAAPAVFGSPVAFYASAKLSAVTFAADFVLTLLYSDDPRLATGDNIAIPIPPTVIAHTPLDGALGVSIATRPTATFSVTMEPATITELTFTLWQGGSPIPASVTYEVATRTATLTPDSALALGVLFEARVTTGAVDTGGTPMAADLVWTFTTAACSQGPVELGAAAGFAVLASSTVTSTGPTWVTGDLGVSPGTAVTGFPPGTLVGTLHVADASALAASVDLSTAYSDVLTRSVCPIVVAGDLGGMTLTPGLYRSSSSLEVALGNLTLDAQGEVDAVFVIQIASTLSFSSTRRVLLVDGARAANIYWQVGTSATLQSTSHLEGTILASESISMQTGATLSGRALAHTGAVTLDSNTVTEPAP
jgi:hypothetical protein